MWPKGVLDKKCPWARKNVTLSNLPLSFSKFDLNLSFYFNCSSYCYETWYLEIKFRERLKTLYIDVNEHITNEEGIKLLMRWLHLYLYIDTPKYQP